MIARCGTTPLAEPLLLADVVEHDGRQLLSLAPPAPMSHELWRRYAGAAQRAGAKRVANDAFYAVGDPIRLLAELRGAGFALHLPGTVARFLAGRAGAIYQTAHVLPGGRTFALVIFDGQEAVDHLAESMAAAEEWCWTILHGERVGGAA